MQKDTCEYCHKELTATDLLLAAEGLLFCCKDCAVAYYTDEIIRNASESAVALVNDLAEEISASDIGIE